MVLPRGIAAARALRNGSLPDRSLDLLQVLAGDRRHALQSLANRGHRAPEQLGDLVERHLVDEVVNGRLLRLEVELAEQLPHGVAILEELGTPVAFAAGFLL